ncbi:MAG: hypothetical protein ABIA77_04200, partial [Candidatus Omnitrophota bacterium]
MKRFTGILSLTLGLMFSFSLLHAASINELSDLGDKGDGRMGKMDQDIGYTAWDPYNHILKKMGLGKIQIQISEESVKDQSKDKNLTVPFENALQEAMRNLLVDARDKNSLAKMALTEIRKEKGDGKEIREKVAEKARKMINRADSALKLFSRKADKGELPSVNWIFYLHSPAVNSKGFFIIIDKSGRAAAYNYAALTVHNNEEYGSGTSSPEIPAGQGGLEPKDVFGSRSDSAIKGNNVATSESVLRQGKVLYDNYGAPLTMVGYDGWPGNIPVYGDFAAPFKNYLANARKIDKLRIDMRGKWIRLSEDLELTEAQKVLGEMKAMGREYDKLVGECIQYVRQGQQLYAEGKATFPSLLYTVKLVKGSVYIDLYDDNGKKIVKKVCKRWGSKWSWLALNYTVVCVEYREVPVRAKVPDYYLEYGYGGDQTYPQRARMIDVPPTPAFPEVFVNKSVQRDQYDMEVIVTCALDKDPGKGWLITSAKLRKGKASSSDALGGGVSVGGKVGVPLVAEGSVNVNINYSHSWNHFRFGEMVEFP